MTIITLPHRSSRQSSTAEPLADAALEWARTNDQLEKLAEQINSLAARRTALAGATAAHIVLLEHPSASVLIFAVRDGRPRCLSHVLDSQGRIIPARSTGRWAESVLGAVINEDLSLLGQSHGVQATPTSLRIDVEQVIAAAGESRKSSPTSIAQLLPQAA
jgi:hypothetical protein